MWFAIYKRELKAYLQSPVVYVIGGIFLFLTGYFTIGMMIEYSDIYNDFQARRMYSMENMNVTEWVIRGFLGLINFLMLFIIPLLTMRLLAEEKKNRTFEVLVTCPVKDGAVLAGKYLASMSVFTAFLLICLIYPALVEKFSDPEWPVVWTGYLGLLLSMTAYFAFGIFASSITENQIIAAFLCFAGLLFFYLVGEVTSSQAGWIGNLSGAISLRRHSMNFIKGVVEAKDVFYFIAFTVFFLFLSLEMMKIRRWRS